MSLILSYPALSIVEPLKMFNVREYARVFACYKP
jgi:hypothetical protein